MPPVLGYWSFRGPGEPLRMLLHHTGTEFEDKRFTIGPPPDYERDEYINLKYNLGLDFPNLPYYIDGDLKLTQSLAIARHIARKHGLMPDELSRGDMAEQQVRDLLYDFAHLTFLNKNFESEKDGYVAELQNKLAAFSKFMGNGPWLLGKRLTYVDFFFYECLDWHLYLDPTCLDSFPNLETFMQGFKSLPNVAKYLNSDSFKNWPLINPFAQFGGTGEAPKV